MPSKKVSMKDSLTNQTSIYGIMGGIYNRKISGRSSTNRATSRLVIPSAPFAGLHYMRMNNLLSRNPQCSGGVGRMRMRCENSSNYSQQKYSINNNKQTSSQNLGYTDAPTYTLSIHQSGNIIYTKTGITYTNNLVQFTQTSGYIIFKLNNPEPICSQLPILQEENQDKRYYGIAFISDVTQGIQAVTTSQYNTFPLDTSINFTWCDKSAKACKDPTLGYCMLNECTKSGKDNCSECNAGLSHCYLNSNADINGNISDFSTWNFHSLAKNEQSGKSITNNDFEIIITKS